ncbi:hypothetical protein DL546_001114 [Coniochaeta pulveracea]|uniref:Malate dehydrogenase n=1 Tax=Coniochaeta pulveracea TaxID=177199 RepID=A0A420YAK5_9PEZI|nr:hypothetical protein DL546_001114 [Coniochaeta pulveracea]
MHASTLLLSALGATVLAAPTYPTLVKDSVTQDGLDTVSQYFNLVARKVQEVKSNVAVPVCDLSKASMPAAPSALPPPTAGLVLKHVALGRGTQNYTCDTTNATAVPVAVGALATLFNASCVASSYPDLLNLLPKVAMQFNLTAAGQEKIRTMVPGNMAISGEHFFTNPTTPFFDLNQGNIPLGSAPCAKNNSSPAPADAPKGQGGEAAVPWLKLLTKVGATGDLQEVYRVETAGGSAPATCKGLPAAFNVQYSAQYWFYESSPKKI